MLDQLNKILLPQDVEESFLKITSQSANIEEIEFSLDPNSYNYIFEEFISRGAINMVLLPKSGYISNLDTYDSQLKKRTIIADKNLKALSLLNHIFTPIAQELNIDINLCLPNSTLNYQRQIVFNEHHFTKRQLLKSFAIAYENIYPFLIGLRENAQVSIKLSQTLNALSSLKSYCKDTNSRKNCAIIIGVLQTYKPLEVPGLSLQKSSATLELVNNFKYFIKDEVYKEYSYYSFSLGTVGIKIQETIDNIGRALNKLIKKNRFNETIDFGTKIITTSTGIPIPSYKAAENLLKVETFLPPIISLSDLLHSAKANWIQNNPSLSFVDLGVDIMKDALDIEHPLEYTLQDKHKNNVSIILKMSSRFDGKSIAIDLIPNIILQNETIDAFKELHKSNFSTPIFCANHNLMIEFSDLKLDYDNTKIHFSFTPCCENNYVNTIAHLLSVNK